MLAPTNTPSDHGDVTGENRDIVIPVRLTKTEHAAWLAAAEAAGLKLSEYIRRRVNGETAIAVPAAPTAAKPKRRGK
jgi:hypothetical protein